MIPDSVTSIGNYAFFLCENLASANIPSGVTSIGNQAFYGCKSLSRLSIPSSVTSIGDRAFGNSLAIISVNSGNQNYSSQDGIFYNKEKTELIFCGQIGRVTVPNGVQTIRDNAFYGNFGLMGVTIPESVTSIGNEAFRACNNLTGINIPKGVASIGNYAFWDCQSLKSVTLPSTLVSIGTDAFAETQAEFTVSYFAGEQHYSSVDGCLYNDEQTELIRCKRSGTVTIPNGVKRIGAKAAYGCGYVYDSGTGSYDTTTGITAVTIPSSVAEIGEQAFYGCSALKTVTVPSGVKSIGNQAFYNCLGLTAVVLPESVVTFGNKVFDSSFDNHDLIVYGKGGSAAETYVRRYGPRFCDQSLKNSSYYRITVDSAVYNGKAQQPKVTVVCISTGKALKEGTDYTVAYKDNTNVGTKAKAIITGKGLYTDTVTQYFTIKKASGSSQTPGNQTPGKDNQTSGKDNQTTKNNAQISSKVKTYEKAYGAKAFNLSINKKKGYGKITYKSSDTKVATVNSKGKVTIKGTGVAVITATAKKTAKYKAATVKFTVKVSPAKQKTPVVKAQKGKKIRVSWKKDKRASGYQIQYSTNRNFKGKKTTVTKKVTKNKTISLTIKKLQAGKKYHVRVRAYKNVKINKKTTPLYGAWSSYYTVKAKK